MQLTELIHHSRSSTLPSISATTATTTTSSPEHTLPLPSRQDQLQSKEVPSHLTKRISLPPISDLLATPPPPTQLQQQQQHQQQQRYQIPQHYNYYTTTTATATNNSSEYLNRSPNPGYSTSSSISSPSSIQQYHNQQLHYFHSNAPSQQQQQQQQQKQLQLQLHLPSMMRSNSYPQQSSTLGHDQSYFPPHSHHYNHHPLSNYPSHDYYPRHQQHPQYAATAAINTNNSPNHNGVINNSNKRKTRNNLPKEITYVLLRWLNDHLNHPYPNSFEKNQLMMATGLNQQQLSNWFINARRRKIKTLKEQKRMMHLV